MVRKNTSKKQKETEGKGDVNERTRPKGDGVTRGQ